MNSNSNSNNKNCITTSAESENIYQFITNYIDDKLIEINKKFNLHELKLGAIINLNQQIRESIDNLKQDFYLNKSRELNIEQELIGLKKMSCFNFTIKDILDFNANINLFNNKFKNMKETIKETKNRNYEMMLSAKEIVKNVTDKINHLKTDFCEVEIKVNTIVKEFELFKNNVCINNNILNISGINTKYASLANNYNESNNVNTAIINSSNRCNNYLPKANHIECTELNSIINSPIKCKRNLSVEHFDEIKTKLMILKNQLEYKTKSIENESAIHLKTIIDEIRKIDSKLIEYNNNFILKKNFETNLNFDF